MADRLDGRVVVIVGGTSGIGASAVAACLAAGARLVVVGRPGETISSSVQTDRPGIRLLRADATHSQTASDAIELALKEFGRFDALYHVAGGSGRKAGDGPLHELSDEGWRYTLELNQTSLFYSNRAAVKQFLAQKSPGSILNIGSVLGFSPSPHHFATHAYAAAKAAAIGLTRSCAAYYAPHGIRFNLIAPGLVETPMAQRSANDARILHFISTKQPLDGGRIGQPQDLDAAAVFFLSDESRFITGQILSIDGGWSVSEGQVAE
ncbi:MAG TPA: SDR family oxidoreductase [Tepidisphaeraceae bacterium]|jgi:NAD(P)-dependent dehydrogenase (short-subunit alcohol dehydrogenase family)|nr:SDR family oxidoreductase [Tepidisphaeraceae bacterium]